MILQLFKRSLKEHFGFHLLIPALLVFGISAWSEASLRGGGASTWLSFAYHWPASHLGSLLEIYAAFFLVVAWSIKRASDVQSTRVETVRDILPHTKRYFAVGVIPIREWFDPNTTVYLTTIVQHQLTHPHFSHERVLLFTRDSDLKAVSVSYLDEPYAKALTAIHKQFDIPLTYLTPAHYATLVSGLSPEERRALKCERRILAWLRSRIQRMPRRWTLRAVKPFVLLEKTDGSHVVMAFTKRGRTLTLSRVKDENFVRAAETLVERISKVVYLTDKTPLEEFSFSNVLQL